jgi:hypothetical protein
MTEKDNNNNTFGSFNNKYVRGVGATILAAIAAKNDPYLLEGFAEKVDELEKADRARRDKFIEASTAAATKEIARNKLRRLERRQAAEPDIKRAVANGMNPYFAGQAYRTGELKTILKEKAKNPTLNMNSLFQVAKEYKSQANQGFSTDDILEALAGPTVKLTGLLDGLQAPKRTSFLGNFIRGTDEDTTAKDEIDKRIKAQDVSEDIETRAVDFSGASLSPYGQEFLKAAGKSRQQTANQAKSDLAKWVVGTLGLVGLGGKAPISISGDEFVFQSDNVENNTIAKRITDKMSNEVEFLYKNVKSPAYNDRIKALEIVKNKYVKAKEGGGTAININRVNFNESIPIMPENWTPSTPTEEQVEKKEKKRDVVTVLKAYEDIIKSIKDDTQLTTRERNSAVDLQKKIYRNRIKAMMNENPPRATQADLDQIK